MAASTRVCKVPCDGRHRTVEELQMLGYHGRAPGTPEATNTSDKIIPITVPGKFRMNMWEYHSARTPHHFFETVSSNSPSHSILTVVCALTPTCFLSSLAKPNVTIVVLRAQWPPPELLLSTPKKVLLKG